jgi:hypothetical protein
MKGYKLTDIESENMLMIEIDKALPDSDDINKIIKPFINKYVDIQNNKYSKQQSLYRSDNQTCGTKISSSYE